MRRPLVVLSLLVVALLVSACAASEAPGWTYAPPTPAPTPGPSQSAAASAPAPASASAAASAGASAAPSAEGSSQPSAEASGGTGGGPTVINETAQGIAFQQTQLNAPANTPFTIHFDNQDASTIHNIVIKDAGGNAVFTGDLVTGVAQKDYQVQALPAGTYTFVCQVHANMTGTLTVGP
jgi:plastocyanin